MILILDKGIRADRLGRIHSALRHEGCSFRQFEAGDRTLLEVGGKPGQDLGAFEGLRGVERAVSSPEACKLASRESHPADTVVHVGDVEIGGHRLVVIAGPCSVESLEQALAIAQAVGKYGAVLFRGGAFKPRSSPYAFQGLGKRGLEILGEVRRRTGLGIVSEVIASDMVAMMLPYVDVLQVGARNMQNFELLKAVGRVDRPVLLKRGLSATIEEWLMSAEYILSEGNRRVILCERGIRTFESYTRNTLDLSAIPVLKQLTHLPVIVDPSHATGIRDKVLPMARAGVAAGADGLIIEVHNEPDKAQSDGAQSLLPEQFGRLMRDIYVIAPVVDKQVDFDYLEKAAVVGRTPARRGAGRRRVSFFGESGTFAHKACVQFFGASVTAVPARSQRAVFDAVRAGDARFGIVALENALTGSVHENYDLLMEYDLRIVGEVTLRMVYGLIVRPGGQLDRIRRVFSHPHIFQQCRQFVESHGWELVSARDEAAAVRLLKERGRVSDAAIAGREAAALHGMQVLQEGIETNPRNYTRFAVIGKGALARGRRRKSSLIYATPNKPGALYETLGVFAQHRVNLVKLESRPVLGKPWAYMFYVEVEADAESKAFARVLKALHGKTESLRILGTY